MKNTYELFLDLRKKFTDKEISEKIDVNQNTVKRWLILRHVPQNYHFDLMKLLDIEIDYSIFSEKDKDQFFTSKKTAEKCIKKLYNVLENLSINTDDYIFLEPSAGDGSFFSLLPEKNRFGIDIEPKVEGVVKGDFLKWSPNLSKKIITIGNPPFGLRGNLALRFINHAEKFSDFVAFILPQSFDSNGKGSCKSRVKNLNLIHSETIDSDFYYPNGTEVKVNVVFQIWNKSTKKNLINPTCDSFIKLYSVSDGGTPSTTRNRNHWYNCDLYLPTTSFKEDMKIYNNFDDLPQRRGYGIKILKDRERLTEYLLGVNWKEKSVLSTNGAHNLRFDLIKQTLISEGFTD